MIDIAKIGKELMIKEPFYGLFLLNLNKIITKEVPTAGVGLSGINTVLYVNEEFMESLSMEERLAVIKHECIHLCFQHPMMGKSFFNHKLFNLAGDIEINQLVQNLPKGAITLNTFPELNLPPRAGSKKYYELLQQNLNSNKPNKLLQQLTGENADDIHGT